MAQVGAGQFTLTISNKGSYNLQNCLQDFVQSFMEAINDLQPIDARFPTYLNDKLSNNPELTVVLVGLGMNPRDGNSRLN